MKKKKPLYLDWLFLTIAILTTFSFLVILYTLVFGFWKSIEPISINLESKKIFQIKSVDYSPYWQKINWSLYFLFFPIVGVCVWKTWNPFIIAWNQDGEKESLYVDKNGTSINKKLRKEILDEIQKSRKIIIIFSLFFSAAFNFIDYRPMAQNLYFANDLKTQIEYIQGGKFDKPPANADFLSKFVIDHIAENKDREISTITKATPKTKDFILWRFCQIQQFAIIWLGFIVLFQTPYHILKFNFFGKIPGVAKKHKLQIHLNNRASHEDFGLRLWNRALDTAYFWMSAAMLPALISRVLHSENPNPGHEMGSILLGCMLIAPIVLNIAGRQHWLADAEDRATKKGKQTVGLFKKQKLWPLDSDRFKKIWIAASFTIYGYYVSGDTWKIIKEIL